MTNVAIVINKPVTGTSVNFTLTIKANNVYTCTLRVKETTEVVNMAIVSKMNSTQMFTGLEPATVYKMTCAPINNMKKTSVRMFRTSLAGMCMYVRVHNANYIIKNHTKTV